MTLVLLHRQPSQWWAYADSRISGDEGPLLESAPKLLSLPVRVFKSQSPGLGIKPIFQTSFAVAYAGSSLAAMCIYGFAATACQSLVLKRGGQIPSLEQLAQLIGRIAKHYIGEIWGRTYPHANRGRVEMFVFGCCGVANDLKAFRITPTILEQFDVEVVELTAPHVGPMFWLAPDEVKAGFDVLLEAHKHDPDNQRPSIAELIRQLIESGRYAQIGGVVQTAMANRSGAWILPTLSSGDGKIKTARANFLNLALDELGPVGETTIGLFADAGQLRK